LANYLAIGDEIAFPVPVAYTSGSEIFIRKSAILGAALCLYLAPIGHVSQPKADKRGQSFVSAEVVRGGLGITAVYLPCEVLRNYFYRVPPADAPGKHRGLYEILGVVPNAAPAEMRVAFKLRTLEMKTAGVPRDQLIRLERAFNILAQPELRACHDACWPIRKRQPSFPAAASVHCW
jgi:hypothetical protein